MRFPWTKKKIEPRQKVSSMTAFEAGLYRNSEDDLSGFDFREVEQYLTQVPIRTLLAFNRGELGQTLGELKRVTGDSDEDSYLQLPDGSFICIRDWNIANYDLDDPDTLGRITVPAGRDADEPGGFVTPWDLAAAVEWEISDDPLDTLAIGGPGDFLERTGLWPHFEDLNATNDGERFLPLIYVAEVKVDGRKVDLFYDVPSLGGYDLCDFDEDYNPVRGPYAGLMEGEAPPPWITLRPLQVDLEKVTGTPNRHLPRTKIPESIGWIQNDDTPPAPYNYFVCQIEEIEDLIFGDAAVLYVFWDKRNTFQLFFQSH